MLSSLRCPSAGIFQFTPPRRGRPSSVASTYAAETISIHAPAKGATIWLRSISSTVPTFQFTPPRRGRHGYCVYGERREDISIHAPAKGATPVRQGRNPALCNFNSRPREGGDPDRQIIAMQEHISIHAPAKGETPSGIAMLPLNVFQFTPPRRGRRIHQVLTEQKIRHFNSRPREGGDWISSL